MARQSTSLCSLPDINEIACLIGGEALVDIPDDAGKAGEVIQHWIRTPDPKIRNLVLGLTICACFGEKSHHKEPTLALPIFVFLSWVSSRFARSNAG